MDYKEADAILQLLFAVFRASAEENERGVHRATYRPVARKQLFAEDELIARAVELGFLEKDGTRHLKLTKRGMEAPNRICACLEEVELRKHEFWDPTLGGLLHA